MQGVAEETGRYTPEHYREGTRIFLKIHHFSF